MTVSDSNGLALVAIAIGLAAVALVWFRGRRSRTSLALAVVIGATASSLALARALTVQRSVQSRAHLLEAIPEHPLPDDHFVTSATCKACHPAQYATWHASYHRTMTQPATVGSVIANFDSRRLTAHGRRFTIARRGPEFWVEMLDPEWERAMIERGIDADTCRNAPRAWKRVVMTTGSHHMQTYWVAGERDGRLYNFPFVWLRGDERWAPRDDVFLRAPQYRRQFATWQDNCIECHSVGGEPHFDRETNTFDPKVGELGIACEACHGPAEHHIQVNHDPWRRYRYRHGDGDDSTVINPERLSVKAATQLCAQCHSMNIFRADPRTGGMRYRAGEELGLTRMVLHANDRQLGPGERGDWPRLEHHIRRQESTYLSDRFWTDGMTRVSGRENNAMVESACFEGGELSCLSCHSMHQSDPGDQLKPGMESDGACFQCHDSYRTKVSEHTHHPPESSGSACLNCHMPHTTYGLLKAIRSHLIDSPTVASTLATGRPNACNLCHLDRTLDWTAGRLHEWYGQPKPPEMAAAMLAGTDESEISAAILWAIKGDAGQRALIAWHMGWEPAQKASGRDWMGIYLGHLLADPYSAVRYIAYRSLKTLRGFEEFDYDFTAEPNLRSEARVAAVSQWVSTRPLSLDRTGRAVLVDTTGNFDPETLTRISRQRDDRPLDLRE
jgi:predicted CXXCH cytochrome family protein